MYGFVGGPGVGAVRARRVVSCCGVSRRDFVAAGTASAAGWLLGVSGLEEAWSRVAIDGSPWEVAESGTEAEVMDVATLPALKDQALAVTKGGEILESFDGGMTWTVRDRKNVMLKTIRLNASEGWIAGSKRTLLYTRDSGRSWTKIEVPLGISGDILLATPTGRGAAEIVTSLGVVCTTADAGVTWKAASKEVPTTDGDSFHGHLRVVRRDTSGNYVGLPGRGSVFFTKKVGSTAWVTQRIPNNATALIAQISAASAKKGSTTSDIWLGDRAGQIYQARGVDVGQTVKLVNVPQFDGAGYGVLDMSAPDQNNAYAVIGSGTIAASSDAGKNWAVDSFLSVPGANLRRIRYPFAFGAEGLILTYRK